MSQQIQGRAANSTRLPLRSKPNAGQGGHLAQSLFRLANQRRELLISLLLLLGVWLVFGQTRHYQFVNYDDDRLIYENAAVTQGLSGLRVAGVFTHLNAEDWWPLTSISHMLDWQLYGPNPGGHHFTNVLLHALTVVLLFLVLRSMTGALWPSAFVAAVFAVHPLRVESVAWVTERKDVLSGLFFVLTLGAYARYVRRSGSGASNANGNHGTANCRPWVSLDYGCMALLFALGLLSKTMLVTLPFVLLLLDYWPLRRLKLSTPDPPLLTVKRLVWEKLPLLLLSVASGVATLLAQQHVIVLGQRLDLSLFSRAGNALVACAVYLRQMFYPVGLAVLYPHPGTRLSLWTAVGCGVVLTLITVSVVRWRRQRPYLLVGWLWYLGMLVPVIGLVQVGIQAHADRYTYLPQIGLYIMVAWGVVDLCAAWRWRRVVLPAAAGMVLAGLLAVAHAQTRYWRDSVSLWTHTLACTSGNFIAHYNLGEALAQQGRLSEAISHFEQALLLQPDSADAQYDWGLMLGKQGNWPDAIPHFERALQLKPDFAKAHCNLGFALAQQGKLDAAIRHYERAIQLRPAYAKAHCNLGYLFLQRRQWNEAILHFERALQLEPDYVEARNNLAVALAQQGK